MGDQEYGVSNGDEQYQQQETYEEQGQQLVEAGSGDGPLNPGDKINASKNDDDERKIFVGGLSWETTVKDLKEYFSKYGDVLDCTLKTDPSTGRSRGFGFVLFADTSSVERVIKERDHNLHGRTIDPKRAKARGGREPIKKVFVGGLDPEVPEADIREYFTTFGTIEDIDLPFDKVKNQRRAFCFITFESEEVVNRVCEEQKQKIGGKSVDVKKATPKSEQGFGGGFGGGRGGGFGQGFGGRGGRGGGRGRGGYNQGYGNQGYDYYNNYNQGYGSGGYDYNQGYGGNGGYDYNSYYNNQGGWGGYGNNQGYSSYGNGGSYDYSGWGYGDGSQGSQPNKQYTPKRGSAGGYHPYSR